MDGANFYRSQGRKRFILSAVIIAAAALIAFYSISVSQYHIGFFEALQIIWDDLNGVTYSTYTENLKNYLVVDKRLPMAVAALLVGAILGIGGAVMQIIIRNPVADPYTVGISSGALFGVTIYIVLGVGISGLAYNLGLMINAFLFALIPVAVITVFSVFKKVTPTAMVLIGIAVMYIFSATTTLLKYTATDDDVAEIYAWSVGTLGKVTWDSIPYLLLALILVFAAMMLMSNKINVLTAGENAARTLGEDPARIRIACLILVSIGVAVAVCYTGTIGFVGLIAPHVARVFSGSNAKYLIPMSAVCGALILIVSETVSRVVGSTGVSVGVITALIGGPVFLFFLMRMRKGTW